MMKTLKIKTFSKSCVILLVATLFFACEPRDSETPANKPASPPGHDHDHDHDHEHDDHDHEHETAPGHDSSSKATNRITLSPEILQNLGIQFVKAESRRLEQRLEIRGRLELPRPSQWTARAAAHGRVTVVVTDLQQVKAGQVLARLTTPELRAIQRAAAAALDARTSADMAALELAARSSVLLSLQSSIQTEIEALQEAATASSTLLADARLAESSARERLQSIADLARDRPLAAPEIAQARLALVEAGETANRILGQWTEQRTRLADRRAESTRLRVESETMADRKALIRRQQASAELALRQQIEALATITGQSATQLSAELEGKPLWQSLEVLEITAPRDGTVSQLFIANEEWVEEGQALVELIDASELHFQGELPESFLRELPIDAAVQVRVLGSDQVAEAGRLRLSPRTNTQARSIIVEAIVPNADRRWPAGLAATASVLLSRAAEPEIVVPEDCVTKDGLEWILFRRDPAQPQQVIRLPVTLGLRSSGWVEVLSGLIKGDSVVREGLHQLKQVGLNKPANGHFHADGSWHEGEEDKED